MKIFLALLSCVICVFSCPEKGLASYDGVNNHGGKGFKRLCIVEKAKSLKRKHDNLKTEKPKSSKLEKIAKFKKQIRTHNRKVVTDENYYTITALAPTDIWHSILQNYLDSYTLSSIRQTCHYFRSIKVFPRIWSRFVATEGVLYLPTQDNFEDLVKASYLIPRCFKFSTYSPTQNFFFEFVELSRAIKKGSFEAVFYLHRLMLFRGWHYVNGLENNYILARIITLMLGKTAELESSNLDLPIKHLILGAAYRYGHGVNTDIGLSMDYFAEADSLGDPRGAIELGRIFEQAPRAYLRSKKEAAKHYESAAKRGATLGYIKLGYLHLKSKAYEKAMAAFEAATEQGDARGYRGLYECAMMYEKDYKPADSQQPDSEIYMEEYVESGDAYALAAQARHFEQPYRQENFEAAWQEGLTSHTILREALPFERNSRVRYALHDKINAAYYNTFIGIIEHDPNIIATAVTLFTSSNHVHFAEKLNQVLYEDF